MACHKLGRYRRTRLFGDEEKGTWNKESATRLPFLFSKWAEKRQEKYVSVKLTKGHPQVETKTFAFEALVVTMLDWPTSFSAGFLLKISQKEAQNRHKSGISSTYIKKKLELSSVLKPMILHDTSTSTS